MMRAVGAVLVAVLAGSYASCAYDFYRQECWARAPEKLGESSPAGLRHPEAALGFVRDAFGSNDFSNEVLPYIHISLREAPASYHSHFLLATFYANRLEEPRLARQGFESALRLFPANGRLHLTYAQWLLAPKSSNFLAPQSSGLQPDTELRTAEKHLSIAMDLEPELVPTGLKLLRWIGSPPADWARWVPETLEAKRHLIIALSDSGHQNDAIQLLESTVRSTADKRFLFEAARRAFEWNAPGLALEAAQRWLEEELRSKKAGPDLAQATLMVARAHLELGEPEPAYRVFRDVLKEMERDSDASRNASLELLTSMGYLYLKAGQTVMAQSLFLKATNVAPHDTAALLGLARTYRRAGNEADAIRCYREILRLRPDDTEIEQELRDLLAARSVADGRQ